MSSSFALTARRSAVRAVLSFMVLAVLCATARLHAAPEAGASSLRDDVLRLATSQQACPPNDLTMTTDLQPDACVAEQIRTTRGWLSNDCVTNLRAPATGSAWPRYEKGDCKGRKFFQAEGVAQARMIARGGGGASANQQWELLAVRKPGTEGRIDYLEYDASDLTLTSDINLVELKKGRPGSTPETTADDQVKDYAQFFPSPGSHIVQPKPWAAKYTDKFSIAQQCGSNVTREVRYYEVESTRDGVAMFWEVDRRTERCDEPPPPPPTDTEQEEDVCEQQPECTPVKFRWDDIERDFRKWAEEHPEEVEAAKQAVAVGGSLAVAALAGQIAAAMPILGALGVGAGAVVVILLLLWLGDVPIPVVSGDPHMYTLDGLAYDLQAVGEFHLLQVPQRDIDVQVRTVGMGPYTSVTNRVATEVGGHAVELSNTGALVDGEPFPLADGEAALMGTKGVLRRQGDEYHVHWVSGAKMVTLSYTRGQVGLYVPPGMPTWGLVGNNDGVASNDLKLEDGSQLPAAASPATIHGTYADSWRIADEESLFHYADGQSTDTFTDRTFPADLVTIGDFPADQIETAAGVCRAAGVEPGPVMDDCVYDLLATGDNSWAATAAAVPDDVVDPTAKGFVSGSLTETFTSPVAQNFASPRYLSDPATSRVAGPFFDSTPYSFYLLDVPRHDQVTMTLRLVAYGNVDTDTLAQTADLVVDGGSPTTVQLQGNAPSTSGPGSIQFVTSGTTADGGPFKTYEVNLPIQHFGTALKVKVVPRNFNGGLGAALGVNKVQLDLTTIPSDDFTVSLPAHIEPGQPGTGAGELETPGAEDTYAFTVASRTSIYLDAPDGGDELSLTLVDQDGNLIRPVETSQRHQRFDDLRAGDYVLHARGDAIPYALDVTVIPDDVSVHLGALDGSPQTLITTAPGQDARVSFDATAGQRVQIQTLEATYSGQGMNWNLRRPDGTYVWGAYFEPWRDANALADTMMLNQSGTWTVVIDPQGTATGSVKARVRDVPTDVAVPLTLGDPAKIVTTTSPGQGAVASFTATQGQRIQLQTTDANYSEGGMRWNLQRPDGSYVWGAFFEPWRPANHLADTMTVDQTGTWRVVIDPLGTATGSVKLRLWEVPPEDAVVQYQIDGPAATVSTTAAGQNAVVKFQGVVGQRIQLQTTDANYSEGGMQWNLQRPDGSYVWGAFFEPWRPANHLADTMTLNQTGTWKVIIDPQGTATGSVKLRAWDVPPDVQTPLTLDDPAQTVTTTSPGQGAVVSFTATQGQRIQLQTTDASYSEGGMQWNLQRPDGSYVWGAFFEPWRPANHLADTMTLNQTGTWKIIIDPQGTATGSVKLRAWDVPPDVQTPLTLDDPAQTVTTTSPGQGAVVSFTATQGQRIQLQTTDASYSEGGMQWNLQRPDGSYVWGAFFEPWRPANHLADTMTLNQTGTWKIIIDPQGTATGSVKVRAWEATEEPGHLTS